jgi:alpha-tubulin suppressor-like RCC1 family protein
MGNVSLGGRVLWVGLIVLVGCQSDSTMAPVEVIPAAAVGEYGGPAAGEDHACVPQLPLPDVLCWGSGGYGQQGDGVSSPNQTPTSVVNGGSFDRLAAGGQFTCALTRGPVIQAYCWGRNDRGQLGDGTRTNRNVPTRVAVPSGVTFTSIAAGEDHVCGLTSAGIGYCWGGNTYGQVGNSTNVDQLRPVPIFDGRPYITISAGSFTTCAVSTIQDAYCWGLNTAGQYGVGDDDARWWYPHQKVESGHKWKTIKVGGQHVCGIRTDNWIWCWGANGYGQLGKTGIGAGEQHIPRSIDMSSVGWSGVDLGRDHTCAIRQSGLLVYCWGRGNWGQVGTGNTANALTPTQVFGLAASNLAAGEWFTVILSTAGEVWTWGRNLSYELGNGTTISSPSPVRILQ